jgi:RNA polymerase-binding transcription factor DksA
MVKGKPADAKAKTSKSKPVEKPVAPPAKGPAPVKPRLGEAERKKLTGLLLNLREDLTGQVANLKNGSLRRDDEVNTVEDGTDAFDRQFALSLASSEQEAVAQINDALRRLSDGTYGWCEVCQKGIEKARLEALPFVRTCIACQSDIERRNVKVRANLQPSEQQEGWDETRAPAAEAEEEA